MFVWVEDKRQWQPRQRGFSLGRIHAVSPKLGEAYFLRILLNRVKVPRSFEELRTVNGQLCGSFRDACYALGLLDDDKEYIEAIKEASFSATGFGIRFLFATLFLINCLSRPEVVLEKTREYLIDGIVFYQQKLLRNPGLSLDQERIRNLALYKIEEVLLRNNSSLKFIRGMPYPDFADVSSSNNHLIMEELSYDIDSLQTDLHNLSSALTDEQRIIYEDIMCAVKNPKGGVYFVYGYGGTGKTYLWKTLSAALRCDRKIVLNVASSGIASLLLS